MKRKSIAGYLFVMLAVATFTNTEDRLVVASVSIQDPEQIPPPKIDSTVITREDGRYYAYVTGSRVTPYSVVWLALHENRGKKPDDSDYTRNNLRAVFMHAERNGTFRGKIEFLKGTAPTQYEVYARSSRLYSRSHRIEVTEDEIFTLPDDRLPRRFAQIDEAYIERYHHVPRLKTADEVECSEDDIYIRNVRSAKWYRIMHSGTQHYGIVVDVTGGPIGDCVTVSFDDDIPQVPDFVLSTVGAPKENGEFKVVFYMGTTAPTAPGSVWVELPFQTLPKAVEYPPVLFTGGDLDDFMDLASSCAMLD